MDNAARQQKGLGLEFGVALTAEQIAQLDGSILWWESVTINGQTVMVPKLYLSPEDITLRIPLYSITDWHRSPISDSHPFDQPGT